MEYYTLTQRDVQYYAHMIPEDIRWQIGRDGYFTVGALETGRFAAGVLQFYVGPTRSGEDFEASITYMYVDKTFRRKGVGTLLLMEMDRILRESGVNYRVFVMPGHGTFEGMKNFLSDYGFSFAGNNFYVYLETIDRILSDSILKMKSDPNVRPIQQLSQAEFREILAKLEEKAAADLASDFERKISNYDTAISSFYSKSDGTGLFLVKRYPSGRLEPVLLRTIGKEAAKGVMDLIARSARAAKLMCRTEDKIRIFCRTEKSEDLMQELYPDLAPEEEVMGVYASEGGEDDE